MSTNWGIYIFFWLIITLKDDVTNSKPEMESSNPAYELAEVLVEPEIASQAWFDLSP